MALAPAINLPEINIAFLHLLTITASKDVIHLVNNDEAITSNGVTFDPYPFSLTLPVSDGEKQSELRLRVDNVDQTLTQAIRELLSPPLVKLEMVLSNDPDTVERTIDFLRADFVNYDSMSVEFRLRPENIMGRKFPSSKYTPARYPDLFWN